MIIHLTEDIEHYSTFIMNSQQSFLFPMVFRASRLKSESIFKTMFEKIFLVRVHKIGFLRASSPLQGHFVPLIIQEFSFSPIVEEKFPPNWFMTSVQTSPA